jgi:hypothetical protein
MTSGSRDDCDDETDRLNAEEDRRRAAELDEQETFPVQVAFALHRDTLVRLLASAPLDHDRDGHLVELTVDQTRAAISARLHRGGTDAAGEWKQGLDTGSDAQVLAWAENHIAAAYPTR